MKKRIEQFQGEGEAVKNQTNQPELPVERRDALAQVIVKWRTEQNDLLAFWHAIHPRDVLRRCADELESALRTAVPAIPHQDNGTKTADFFPSPELMKAACLDCGKDYADFPIDVILPRPQWLTIHPDEDGLLCAACIVARCSQVPRATCCHLIIEIAPPSPPLSPPTPEGAARMTDDEDARQSSSEKAAGLGISAKSSAGKAASDG